VHAHSILESGPSVSLLRRQRRRYEVDDLQGEHRKIKAHTFDGDHKKDEYEEAWLLGMRKYFPFHNYSSNVEAIIASYHPQGKASMW